MDGRASSWVADVGTARLLLHLVDDDEARRILAGRPAPDDRWARGFPSAGDVVAVTARLLTADVLGEQGPFGHYRVTRLDDGAAIGGVGFKGAPVEGCVEVGYGLVPSARGNGYAAEALLGLLGVASACGITRVVADTTADNVASQRTLERAGFHRTGTDEDRVDHELILDRGR